MLLAGLLIYCAGLEVVTRLALSQISRIQRRIHDDLNDARSVAPLSHDGTPTALIVGNSLLLEGVDRISLESALASHYHVNLVPIENTQFEDWYFGLRRLFAEGARPSIVVICLSTRQLMSQETNGEYFAYYLMQGSDLLAVKNELKLDNTMTSAYFFANRSKWLGSRTEIRNWLLSKMMPNLGRLISYLPAKAPAPPPKEQVVTSIMAHLLKLNLLCRANSARLVVVVPPIFGREDVPNEVLEGAGKNGIPVIVPLHSSELKEVDFRDGFHLSRLGAARFTPRLSSELLKTLARTSP